MQTAMNNKKPQIEKDDKDKKNLCVYVNTLLIWEVVATGFFLSRLLQSNLQLLNLLI